MESLSACQVVRKLGIVVLMMSTLVAAGARAQGTCSCTGYADGASSCTIVDNCDSGYSTACISPLVWPMSVACKMSICGCYESAEVGRLLHSHAAEKTPLTLSTASHHHILISSVVES